MTLGIKGLREDLVIRQGADYGPVRGTVKNPDGTPFDLTGCTFHTSFVKKWSSAEQTIALVVTVIDAPNGIYHISIPHEATSTLVCGENEQDPKSQYQWKIDLVEPSERITPIAYGLATVFRNLAE